MARWLFLVLAACWIASVGGAAGARDLEIPDRELVVRAEPPVPAGRLSDIAAPLRYRLDLTIDPDSPVFSGRTEIDVALGRPVWFIDLHGRDLIMHSVAAHSGGRVVEGIWEQRDPTGVARVRFAERLPAGDVTLVFRYEAHFNGSPAGLFRVQVDGRWHVWSQFQSIDARAAFPGFDEPGFKTPFTVVIRTPPGLLAVSNAPLEGEPATEDGLAVHRFAPTLPLPTYLVAIMAGPFVTAEGMAEAAPPYRRDPLPLRIVSTRPNRNRLGFALEQSRPILRLLEEYFGEGHPYPKLDQITSPVLPGAMENAGAALYRDGLLILDEKAPVAAQRDFGRVVAHEIGHQWFGNLVTPEWWDDLWLNESFANWIGYRIAHRWKPELGLGSGPEAEGFAAMRTDELSVGRPIRQPIETSAGIDAAFDSITYGKGGHVIGMIAAFMGEDRFRDAVRRHIARHRHGNATSADFFAALAEESGDAAIVSAMQGFVDQPGIPLLLFGRSGDTYTITQFPYSPLGASPPARQWTVPVCVRLDSRQECRLVDGAGPHSLTLKGFGPLVPNAGGKGYYRFELSRRHWNALIASARRLDAGEALAVVDSLSASLRAGRGNVSELARLARRLVRHEDPRAADAAADALDELVATGIVGADGRRAWRLLRGRMYAPLLRKAGFDPRAEAYAGEDPALAQRRVQIVHKLLAAPQGARVRRQLAQATRAYLDGDRSALDEAWFGLGFDLHIFLGGERAGRDLVLRALASEDPVFRPAALEAAAQSGIAPLARWLLEELDDPALRSNERRAILSGIMARRASRDYGYGWMVSNIEALVTEAGGVFFARNLAANAAHFCSVADAQRIARDLRPHFRGTPGELELERALEKVRNCGVLDTTLGSEISAGFAKLR